MMENSSEKNLDHILSCTEVLPGLPQLRLSLNSAAARIMHVNRLDRKDNAEVCGFCFTVIDVSKAKMELVKVKKSKAEVLNVSCHMCHKVCQTKELEKIPERNSSEPSLKTFDTNVGANKDGSKKKKKRNKDENAGLMIPTVKTPAISKIPEKNSLRSSFSKDKLRLLMSKGNSPKRGGLQDFLKKL